MNEKFMQYSPAYAFTRTSPISLTARMMLEVEQARSNYSVPKSAPADRSDLSFSAGFVPHTVPETVAVTRAAEDAKAHR